MKTSTLATATVAIVLAAICGIAQTKHRNAVIDLWVHGKTAFGVYVPDENPSPRGQIPRPAVYSRDGGAKLAMNPLYDFVFLNLEGSYEPAAVRAIAEGLAKRPGRRR